MAEPPAGICLPMVGARHERSRVVLDGNAFKGGVTSGIDFALAIAAELARTDVASAIQLAIECDPAPPFDSGHPDRALESTKALMTQRNERAHAGLRAGIERLGLKLICDSRICRLYWRLAEVRRSAKFTATFSA